MAMSEAARQMNVTRSFDQLGRRTGAESVDEHSTSASHDSLEQGQVPPVEAEGQVDQKTSSPSPPMALFRMRHAGRVVFKLWVIWGSRSFLR
jgi:hypothetical protein